MLVNITSEIDYDSTKSMSLETAPIDISFIIYFVKKMQLISYPKWVCISCGVVDV